MSQVRIRPMTSDDVALAERVTAHGFHELDTRMFRRAWPDPGGCWVAEDGAELLGVVVSFVREKMWLLASYAVVPEAQGLGLGRALLAPALEHGKGSLRGMLNASNDPKAVRRYHEAGFRLYPQMFLRGRPDRSAIPAVKRVREGSASDVDLMDSVDRRTRGAAHGVDHQVLREQLRLVVCDTAGGQGYAYLDHGVALLAATDRRTAASLLWEAIASSDDLLIGHITPENAWAIEIGLAARLELDQGGYLALRHMKPPRLYLPHGALM